MTTGVAGACCALLVVAAAVRLDQRLRKAGKYSTSKGERGHRGLRTPGQQHASS